MQTVGTEEATTKDTYKKDLGDRGENAAVRFLVRQGYEILERNWTCKAGEADIIALDENTLVFIEVKTRSNSEKGLPEEAVGSKKRKRYEKIAVSYLQHNTLSDVSIRFDVIAILVVSPDRAFLRHHLHAFSAGE